MFEFIATVVIAYGLFKALDYLFDRKRPVALKEGDFVAEIDGNYYIVRDLDHSEVESPHKPHLKVVK